MKNKVIKLIIETETPLNISSGTKGDRYVKDTSIRDRDGQPFISGTTIKGEMRKNYSLMNSENKTKDIFGSRENASRIFVDDFYFINEGKVLVRYGNVIDRFRKVTKDGALFSKEGVTGKFKGEIEINYKDESELEELRLAIKMITSIGGSKSAGFGKVRVEEVDE